MSSRKVLTQTASSGLIYDIVPARREVRESEACTHCVYVISLKKSLILAEPVLMQESFWW